MLNDYATDVTCMHTTVAKRGNGCDNEWLILKKNWVILGRRLCGRGGRDVSWTGESNTLTVFLLKASIRRIVGRKGFEAWER